MRIEQAVVVDAVRESVFDARHLDGCFLNQRHWRLGGRTRSHLDQCQERDRMHPETRRRSKTHNRATGGHLCARRYSPLTLSSQYALSYTVPAVCWASSSS